MIILLPVDMPSIMRRCLFAHACTELEMALQGIPDVLTIGTKILIFGRNLEDPLDTVRQVAKGIARIGMVVDRTKKMSYESIKDIGLKLSAAGMVVNLEDDAAESSTATDDSPTADAAANGAAANGAAANGAAANAEIPGTDKEIAEPTQNALVPRSCSFPLCVKVESRSSKLRCCRRCKDRNVLFGSFYCSKKCQTADWSLRHRVFHKEEKRGNP